MQQSWPVVAIKSITELVSGRGDETVLSLALIVGLVWVGVVGLRELLDPPVIRAFGELINSITSAISSRSAANTANATGDNDEGDGDDVGSS